MAKCTCTRLYHLLKLLTSAMFCHVPTHVSQDGFMLKLICVFLGSDTAAAKTVTKLIGDELVNHFHHVLIHLTNYKMHNILCLNK